MEKSRKFQGVGGVTRSPLERKIQWGGGSNWKKPSVGGVWIFSGTTHCFGFVQHNELWRHNKTCTFKNVKECEHNEDDHKYKNLQQKSKLFLLSHQLVIQSRPLKETTATMKSDNIFLEARV